MARQPFVFISYSRSDAAVAKKISGILDSCGVGCFLDTKSLDWGDYVDQDVASALARSSHLLVIVSPSSLKSLWVGYEIGQAKALGKTVLPYIMHPDLDIPILLSSLHYQTQLKQIKTYFERLAGANQADQRASMSPATGSISAQERETVREERNRSLIEALEDVGGVTRCATIQLDDHSDNGYLLIVDFNTASTSAGAVLSTIRSTLDKLFPDIPVWGEVKIETDDSVGFAFTYIDEYNKVFWKGAV